MVALIKITISLSFLLYTLTFPELFLRGERIKVDALEKSHITKCTLGVNIMKRTNEINNSRQSNGSATSLFT